MKYRRVELRLESIGAKSIVNIKNIVSSNCVSHLSNSGSIISPLWKILWSINLKCSSIDFTISENSNLICLTFEWVQGLPCRSILRLDLEIVWTVLQKLNYNLKQTDGTENWVRKNCNFSCKISIRLLAFKSYLLIEGEIY